VLLSRSIPRNKAVLSDTNWTDFAGDVNATGISSTKTNTPSGVRFYRVVKSPSP